MGIRFACHECDKQLNIKRELAGKRGVCPECSARFRIPQQDAATSTPIESKTQSRDSRSAEEPKADSPSNVTPSPVAATSSKAAATAASADLLVGDPTSTWYVRPPTGGQYGPASPDVLRSWIDQGRVAATSLLWRDGWPQWRVASDVLPELIGSKGAPAEEPAVAAVGSHATANTSLANDQVVALDGRPDMGVLRRNRSGRRIMMIATLLAIAIILIVVLVIILNRG